MENSTNSSVTKICGFPKDDGLENTYTNFPTLWVEIIGYPVLLMLCTVGNTMNLVVLGSSKRKTSTTVYLMCLAVSDLFVL